MALSRLPRLRRGALLGGAESRARPDRAGADRDPRSSDRRRDDGGQRGALQDDVLRRQRALYRRRRGLERDPVGFVSPESFGLPSRSPFWSASSSAGSPRSPACLFGAIFIEFVPNFADQISVNFGESAKALPGAIYGVLLILIMYAMPTGAAGALRAAANASCARVLRRDGFGLKRTAARTRAKYEGKGESHDLTTHIPASPAPPPRRLRCGPGLGRADNAPGVTDTEIKIGQTMPYSGPASAYGVIGRTEAAYFKMINEQGGVNGRKINLISLDDGYSPPKTVEQVRRLVEDERSPSASTRSAPHPISRSDNISTTTRCRSSSSPPARANSPTPSTSPGRWATTRTTRPKRASTPSTSWPPSPTARSACSIRTTTSARII